MVNEINRSRSTGHDKRSLAASLAALDVIIGSCIHLDEMNRSTRMPRKWRGDNQSAVTLSKSLGGQEKQRRRPMGIVSYVGLPNGRRIPATSSFVLLVFSLLSSCCLANAKKKKSNQVSTSLALKREPLSGVSLMTGY